MWSQVHRLAGSGAGALVAALLALNFNSQHLEKLLNFDLRTITQGHLNDISQLIYGACYANQVAIILVSSHGLMNLSRDLYTFCFVWAVLL